MPYEIPECSGKPYRPSNGAEFAIFADTYCYRCEHREECEHAMHAMVGNQPVAWTHDERGRPTCTDYEEKK